MYTAESGYRYGFAGATPGILMALAMFVVGWTGFCVKPLREAGVDDPARALREALRPRACGARRAVVIVLGGLLNMGVFLRTGGRVPDDRDRPGAPAGADGGRGLVGWARPTCSS